MLGLAVDDAEALEDTMARWLAHDGPALLAVKVNRVELVMPPKLEARQVGGSMLFGVRAVLDGRFRELLEVARDNLLR